MVKAVFIDIDKTLLNSDKKMTDETQKAIEKAKKNGVQIFMISGRSRMASSKFQNISSRYIINSNGADIYDCEKKEAIYQSEMEPKICAELYKKAQQENVVIKFDFGLSRAVNKPEFLEDYEVELTEGIDEFLEKNKVIQISICSENLEQVENLKKYIQEKTCFCVINQFIWEVNGKVMHAIHVNNPTVSKGNAMSGLCRFLKIDLKDTVAIGDKINDISMIKMAGFGVAMGNATEDVKEVADFITATNDEDGVAKVLEKILVNQGDVNFTCVT